MIYATHGAVANCKRQLFIHRNMLEEHKFIEWLNCRQAPLVTLSEALLGRGDAVTIDDATYVAGQVAKLVVSLGHKVTLFVNPYHLITAEPYFFALLNPALDHCKRASVVWRKKSHDLSTITGKRDFRLAIKRELRRLNSESDRKELLHESLVCLEQQHVQSPDHLRTLGLKDLLNLRDCGVAIENHGWTHGVISSLDCNGILSEVLCGSEWVKQTLGVESLHFAVPFGETLPPLNVTRAWSTWFLLTDKRPPGWVSSRVYNRQELAV